MRDAQNIAEVTQLPIDIIGLILYAKSARYVGKEVPASLLQSIPKHIHIAGVFVNESLDTICEYHTKAGFSYIQLHGNESPEFCQQVSARTSAQVIKAFHIDSQFSFSAVTPYLNVCSYVLFDTKTEQYGGSGKKYDWTKLTEYSGPLPFFLSGGIGPDDAKEIQSLAHPFLYAIDLNSKFETEPGYKNLETLTKFIRTIKSL